MATFEPDGPITSIKVQLHTAAVSDASTNTDICVKLFDGPDAFRYGGHAPENGSFVNQVSNICYAQRASTASATRNSTSLRRQCSRAPASR